MQIPGKLYRKWTVKKQLSKVNEKKKLYGVSIIETILLQKRISIQLYLNELFFPKDFISYKYKATCATERPIRRLRRSSLFLYKYPIKLQWIFIGCMFHLRICLTINGN